MKQKKKGRNENRTNVLLGRSPCLSAVDEPFCAGPHGGAAGLFAGARVRRRDDVRGVGMRMLRRRRQRGGGGQLPLSGVTPRLASGFA